MIIHPEIEQGTIAWLDARKGRITASEIGAFAVAEKKLQLTIPLMKSILGKYDIDHKGRKLFAEFEALLPENEIIRHTRHSQATIDARNSLYAKKIAEKSGAELLSEYIERITGYTPESLACKRGKELEEEARHVYELVSGENVEMVGFVEHDNGLCGASPDGVIGLDESGSAPVIKGGLEIKCHSPETHVKFGMDREAFISEHQHQTQWQMAVMGTEWIDLFGYCPKLPFNWERVTRSDLTELYVQAIDELSEEYKATTEAYSELWDRQTIELAEIRQRQEGAA